MLKLPQGGPGSGSAGCCRNPIGCGLTGRTAPGGLVTRLCSTYTRESRGLCHSRDAATDLRPPSPTPTLTPPPFSPPLYVPFCLPLPLHACTARATPNNDPPCSAFLDTKSQIPMDSPTAHRGGRGRGPRYCQRGHHWTIPFQWARITQDRCNDCLEQQRLAARNRRQASTSASRPPLPPPPQRTPTLADMMQTGQAQGVAIRPASQQLGLPFTTPGPRLLLHSSDRDPPSETAAARQEELARL